MTNPGLGTRQVPAADRVTRRRTAAIAFWGFLVRDPVSWALALIAVIPTVGVLGTAGEAWEVGLRWTAVGITVVALLFELAFLATFPLLDAVVLYRAPHVLYLNNGHARAALAVKPDRRPHAQAGDLHGYVLAAWPPGHGAGMDLLSEVTAQVHRVGGRLTATAMPWLAPAYQRRGAVVEGRTWWGAVRVASRPRKE